MFQWESSSSYLRDMTAVRCDAGSPQVPWTAVRCGAEIGLLSLMLSVSQGASMGDFPLAPACPMEKVNPWKSFLYLTSGFETDEGVAKGNNCPDLEIEPTGLCHFMGMKYTYQQGRTIMQWKPWMDRNAKLLSLGRGRSNKILPNPELSDLTLPSSKFSMLPTQCAEGYAFKLGHKAGIIGSFSASILTIIKLMMSGLYLKDDLLVNTTKEWERECMRIWLLPIIGQMMPDLQEAASSEYSRVSKLSQEFNGALYEVPGDKYGHEGYFLYELVTEHPYERPQQHSYEKLHPSSFSATQSKVSELRNNMGKYSSAVLSGQL